MKYISTRDKQYAVSGSEAVVKGISRDGGLFVPENFPKLGEEKLIELAEQSYEERAAYIMSLFLDEYSYEELLSYAEDAYGRFEGDPCPLVNIDDGLYFLELWHGPTYAFKDVALTMLPKLLAAAKKKLGETDKTLILVATSGDTGKAALEGFRDIEDTDIIVFYPDEGVSLMQQLQMSTQQGNNVYVGALRGNFDDAQNAVKSIFADENLAKQLKERGYKLSSANSINWGRLLPQIAYYVSAYCDLIGSEEISCGEKVNFCVPTGNFGNILAGYYAYRMGLPINKLICASNVNNILTDFLSTGVYDVNREFHKTMSPSMDIIISSNLERLLFEILGRDDSKVRELMAELKAKGRYSISPELIEEYAACFEAGFATEQDTTDTIFNNFDIYDYILDPHTAVAAYVYNEYILGGDMTPTVIVSTANPYKFSRDVYAAISEGSETDDFSAIRRLNLLTGFEVPEGLAELKNLPRRFTEVLDKTELINKILEYTDNRGNNG